MPDTHRHALRTVSLNVPRIVQARQQRRLRARRSPAGRLALGCSAFLSLLAALTAAFLALAYLDLTRALPSLEALPVLLEPPRGLLLQPTRLYDRSGRHLLYTLENPASTGRRYLRWNPAGEDQPGPFLPSTLISATLTVADPDFWNHSGFTLAGLFQGRHPTLAQRLVSDLLLWDERPGLRRNLRERILAAQITSLFGREKILEWYLNSANYGPLVYGADAAALASFARPAEKLTLAEAALLAASAESPALSQPVPDQSSLAPAFTNLVLQQLGTQIDRARLERGGFIVTTTLDYDLQMQAACAASNQLARLASPPTSLPTADLPAADGSACRSARLLSTQPGSSILTGLAGSVVVLDPQTGQILALVGEPSPGRDPANLPGHPPGSLLTPFIYLTAFARSFSPATLVWDIPTGLPGQAVQNFDGKYHGPLRLRMALANDYLLPAVQILAQVGPENAWRTAQQLGVRSLMDSAGGSVGNILLDGGEVTLLEASQAFGVFSNQGTLAGRILESASPGAAAGSTAPLEALSVLLVEDAYRQRTWLDWEEPQYRPVINPQLAYLITNVMSDETARWPSLGHPNLLEVGRPAAAKLGRTASGQDVWTMGYTPQRVVGVWVGDPEPVFERQAPGAPVPPEAAASLWHAVLQYAHQNLPPQEWVLPPAINTLAVCDPSGMLPTPECPAIVNEVFLAGTEPVQADPLFQSFQINRETGRLATVFTPSELVEERVYLVVPPEAMKWAREAGVTLPPESYDVILSSPPSSPDLRITSPGMFSAVKGQVPVLGRAGGSDLAFFRLQVGAGLNPQEWLQVGQDMTRRVLDGRLGIWDTSGLNGLYTLQLLAVNNDQQVESAIVQVTVDNQPPEVRISYPLEGQQLPYTRGRMVNLQVSAADNLSVTNVVFSVDGHPALTLEAPPYVLPWQAKPGSHTLQVIVTDQAGNTSEAQVSFTVK